MGVAKIASPYQILKNSKLVTERGDIIGAYNIDDLYHIGRIDTHGITLIIIVYFLVVICTVLLSYLISCCMTSVLSIII